mgnify:CR=1 FL=1
MLASICAKSSAMCAGPGRTKFMKVSPAISAPSGSSLEECICVHAEQNAICQAAYHGIALAGATIYVTISPCLTCAKMIINAGIREVVYGGDYAFTEQTERLLKEAKVTCRRFVKP